MDFGVVGYVIAGLAMVGFVVVGAVSLKGLVWLLVNIEDAFQPTVKQKRNAPPSAAYTGHGT